MGTGYAEASTPYGSQQEICDVWGEGITDAYYSPSNNTGYVWTGGKFSSWILPPEDFDNPDIARYKLDASFKCSYKQTYYWREYINGSYVNYSKVISEYDERSVGFADCPTNQYFDLFTWNCGCKEADAETWSSELGKCVPLREDRRDRMSLDTCVGNPISPVTGAKMHDERIGYIGSTPINLNYSNRQKLQQSSTELVLTAENVPSFGPLWQSNVHKKIRSQTNSTNSSSKMVQAGRGSNTWLSFLYTTGTSKYFPINLDVYDRVYSSAGFRYDDGFSQEVYNSYGFPGLVAHSNGSRLTYTYSDLDTPVELAPEGALLLKIQDQTGRTVNFRYERPNEPTQRPRIIEMIDAAGNGTSFGYDAHGNLTTISWPDGATRQFLYENVGLPWALTGLIDENNVRHSTYEYDTAGRATSTQLAGGVNSYSVVHATEPTLLIVDTYDSTKQLMWRRHQWAPPQGTTVTLPNGQASSVATADVLGMARMTAQSQPAGSGCAASTSNQGFDAFGNVAYRDDFNSKRTCYAYDTLNRETARVEGLSNLVNCSTVLPTGTLPSGTRKVSTQWHADWKLPTKVAEPGRITTYAYNTSSASCASTAPLMPDGKVLPVVCSRTEQATTDDTGTLGISAALQSGVANRQWTYTYNSYGQVLTEDGPRTDVSDLTTYTYYTDTTADHTLGDLATVTNAAGKTTSYPKYNKHGQVLRMVDANAITTDYTYDLRQRLTSVSVGGQLTTYAYWPTGLLKKVTEPDLVSFVAYEYDDAHRLTAVADNLGNRIEYTLDNSGNRTGEAVRDPNNNLRRQVTRVMDALNRVQQTTGRE